MGYLPINIDIQDQICLVVGGGEVGLRKVETLLEAGARVRLVSRELLPRLRELADAGRIDYLGPDFDSGHADGAALVFAATSDSGLNAGVSRAAKDRRIPVNVADQPELCTFIVPAAVRRGGLTISISTSGKSPALAARIRAALESEFGPEYGDLLTLMGLIREKRLAGGRPSRENRDLFRRLAESRLAELLAAGELKTAEDLVTGIMGPDYSFAGLGFFPAGADK